jgi:hypothetical protein
VPLAALTAQFTEKFHGIFFKTHVSGEISYRMMYLRFPEPQGVSLCANFLWRQFSL